MVMHLLSQIFALAASIIYLLIFLFLIHNTVIRLTKYNSRLSKAAIATGFLFFSALFNTIMCLNGRGSATYLLPSHLFVLGLTWAEYIRGNKQNQSS